MQCENDLAVVIYTRKYRERSLFVDTLTLSHGKLHVLVNPDKLSKIGNGTLRSFCLLNMSWKSAGKDLFVLDSAEDIGCVFDLSPPFYFVGTYLNELIYRIQVGTDNSCEIFTQYIKILDELTKGKIIKKSLRIFEMTVLNGAGYAVNLTYEASDFDKEGIYEYKIGEGFVKVKKNMLIKGPCFRGIDLYQWYFHGTDFESKILQEITSYSLSCLLQGFTLRSRDLYRQYLRKTQL